MCDAQVELYIDQGDLGKNKLIFDALFAQREKIRETFGESLEWQWLDDRRASRIRRVIPGGGLRDQDRWPKIHEQMIGAMIRLERALKPEIQRLK